MGDQVFERAREAAHAVGAGQAEWRDVVEATMALMGAERGAFLCFDRSGNVIAMESLGHDPKMLESYVNHYHQFDEVAQRGWSMPTGSWLDARYDSRASDGAQMFWTDFLNAHRIAQISALQIHNHAGVMAAVSVQTDRPREWTHVQEQSIREHQKTLCEAFARRRATAEASLAILESVLNTGREGYCVVSELARIVTLGPGTEALLCGDSMLTVRGKILAHRHPEWNRRLLAGIRTAGETAEATLALPDGWGKSWRLHMKRLDSALSMGFHRAVGIRIERRDIFEVPSAAALGELFALSPAEAALCHHLVAGHSVAECADLLDISVATARKQLSSIFHKTGCNRQTELIRLASGL